MSRTKKYSKKKFAEAIVLNDGYISEIAKHLDCSCQTVKNYLAEYEDLAELKESIDIKVLDLAESVIRESLSNGDLETAKWVLLKKGGNRGYSNKPLVNINNNYDNKKTENNLYLQQQNNQNLQLALNEMSLEEKAILKKFLGKTKELNEANS